MKVLEFIGGVMFWLTILILFLAAPISIVFLFL